MEENVIWNAAYTFLSKLRFSYFYYTSRKKNGTLEERGLDGVTGRRNEEQKKANYEETQRRVWGRGSKEGYVSVGEAGQTRPGVRLQDALHLWMRQSPGPSGS